MQIIILVKPVPDLSEARVSKTQAKLIEQSKRVLNPVDRHVVETALQIRERYNGEITAICLGEKENQSCLKDTYALGVDRAVLLSDPSFCNQDRYVDAVVLSKAITKIGKFDLIIAGAYSIIHNSGEIGPRVAELLSVKQYTYIDRINIQPEKIVVEWKDNNFIRKAVVTTPAVITVTPQINTPRIPTALQIMKSVKKEIICWNKEDLELDISNLGESASHIKISSTTVPE